METIKFEIKINADAKKVYRTMLGLDSRDTYNEWTAEFSPSSTVEGDWQKGSKMLFVGYDSTGKRGGMVSVIEENIPDVYVSIKHIGVLDGDNEINEGEAVDKWAGSLENYFFEEDGGVTTVRVECDTVDEYKDFFDTAWPKALNKLKEICEK